MIAQRAGFPPSSPSVAEPPVDANDGIEQDRGHPWPLYRRMVKRAFDVVVAGSALAVLGAPLALLGLAVRRDSPGPALFRQERMGRGGRKFHILKLRTMIDGADRRGLAITSEGDARVTRLGRLLRRSKLDELPQLWNVLRGDMSLVGPRPEVPKYRRYYSPLDEATVLAVRPGLTDPASIEYRNEERVLGRYADRERAYVEIVLPTKLALARRYIPSQSLLGDLLLLAQTVAAVMLPR